MNIDNFLIEERDLELAQTICKPIKDSEIKNRALANAMASNIASKFFEEAAVDTESGLHNIPAVLEDIDIADIYINNCYIDVRVFFDEEELAVPKAHFDNKLLPAAYMFIKLTPDLSGATVIGFILPENINTSKAYNGYYKVSYDSLVSFYDIESSLITKEDSFGVDDRQIFAYLDNTLEDKNKFYSDLIGSKDGRLRLAKASKAQYIFNFVSIANSEAVPELASTDDLELVADDSLGLEEVVPDSLIEQEIEPVGFDDELSLPEEDVSLNIEESVDIEEPVQAETEESLEEISEESDGLEHLDFNPDSIGFVNDPMAEEESPAPVETSEEEIVEMPDELGLMLDEDISEDVQEDSVIDEIESVPQEDAELNTIADDSSFKDEYKTVTSPSLDVYEELENEEESEQYSPEEDSQEEEKEEDIGEEIEPSSDEITEQVEDSSHDSSEEIETLFNAEAEDMEETELQPKKGGNSLKILLIIAFLAVIGTLGYYGVSKFLPDNSQNNLVQEPAPQPVPEAEQQKEPEAMPVETVEAPAESNVAGNEGNAVSIPAIEQNLDASILVSNLRVDWEVPSGYASNSSARRYLVKLGKIVQLNLKTELLLLNKPPITNKIAVEIKFNPSTKKFEPVGITTFSGEQTVDDLILKTVQRALGMKLNMNSDSFAKLKGNPVLIIRL